MRVVSNTSPLSNLAIVDLLELLRLRYMQVFVPDKVWEELKALSHVQGLERIEEAVSSGWLIIESLPDASSTVGYELRVDPGEAAAIALAEHLGADKVLVDDRLGRELAHERGVASCWTSWRTALRQVQRSFAFRSRCNGAPEE